MKECPVSLTCSAKRDLQCFITILESSLQTPTSLIILVNVQALNWTEPKFFFNLNR